MSQLSEEQQWRLRQIREIVTGPNYYHEGRFYKSRYDNYLLGDALLLLQECVSLLDSDSQAAGNGCGQCGGPHEFDTSIPSAVWNQVIRARGLSDYLCATCIVREFVRVGQGFTATLWSEEFNGIPIEVVVNGQNAKDAALVQEENNSLRNQINDAAQSIVNEAEKVGQLMQSSATTMRDKCVETLREMLSAFKYTDEEVIAALSSLTLDQVKPGEM